MQVSTNKTGTVADFNAKRFDKQFKFVLNHQNPNPSMKERYFPNGFAIPLVDIIFDHTLNKRRMIRYIPGEMSIYADEQKVEAENIRTQYAEFSKNGDLIIDGHDSQKLEFMMISNFNGSNPRRDAAQKAKFYTLDLGSQIRKEKEIDEKLTNAKQWCYEANWDQIKSYARVLGLRINEDADEVRWNLKLIAEKDPVLFLAGLNNKLTQRKHYVLEAIDKGILMVDNISNSLSWANGSNICISPMGKDPIDHFVDLTETKEGQRTYDSVLGLVSPSAKPAVEITSELHNVAPVAKEMKEDFKNEVEGLSELSIKSDSKPSEDKSFNKVFKKKQ